MTEEEVKAGLYTIIDRMNLLDKILNLPKCETCGFKVCKYRPEPGEWTRLNCPLWKAREN